MYLNNAKKEEMIRQIHRNDRSQHLPNRDQREQKKAANPAATTGKPHTRTAINGSSSLFKLQSVVFLEKWEMGRGGAENFFFRKALFPIWVGNI